MVEINGKLFDIYTHMSDKIITVQGYVDNMEEIGKVEKYFKLMGVPCQNVIIEQYQ